MTSTDTTSPALRTALAGAVAYRDFMAPFLQMLKGSSLIAAFGDEKTAVVVYDAETVPRAPAAECVTVHHGKITYRRFIVDRAPFQAARKVGN